MLQDLWTVIWKEWREYLPRGGATRATLVSLLFLPLLFGVVLPSQRGLEWLNSWPVLILAVLVPSSVVSGVVADAFAGERERHTLETLLASRLPDMALLYGKLVAAVLYGWGIALLTVLVGAVTVNLKHPEGGPHFYQADIAFAAVLLTFVMALLTGAAGVLISLRVATVRQAQQLVGLTVIIPSLVPTFGLNLLSAQQRLDLLHTLATTNSTVVVLVIAGGLLAIDLILLAVATTRFRRPKLLESM